MQSTWTYKTYEINEGLKPGSKTFRFFFRIFEAGEKKCSCCVWILDDALGRFDATNEFKAIVDAEKASWHQWVRQKIDESDFRDRVLKFSQAGQEEIDLSLMASHVSVD